MNGDGIITNDLMYIPDLGKPMPTQIRFTDINNGPRLPNRLRNFRAIHPEQMIT